MIDHSNLVVKIKEGERISGLPPELEVLYLGKTNDGLFIIHAQGEQEHIFLGMKDEIKMTAFKKIRQAMTTIYLTPYQFVVFSGRPALNLYRGHILTQLEPIRA
ncbi:MAG: hypothetical protein UT48_C0010G0055 [Parcubacteria group bacterium GW2011_GWE2_39_37]|uniref:Uncharacterized protein n=1 Tax=Candidatus Falkowbacteria bacterium GW2011_GWF2_39_8 TaxID=1618642 RepID=A0A0G0PYW5_9BACT|nr:MAG: hypothetical protein UT48_C0010G0055 [Parcubacteria group bacterium GW2011_GWE2_39_37]KKR33344.1 MAG: hypothetical protein UT64_C0010G0018 [Candidatus Falkowbacteria bacterium GW2011_GWF2_39_8]